MRTAEFDRTEVLEQAMQLFRTHGYARTTMQALVSATGLHPGSLYAAFGNKRGLLEAVIEHYVSGKRAQRQQMLEQASALDGIRAYLGYLWQQGQAGTCLVMRSMIELSSEGTEPCQILSRLTEEMETDLRTALQRAVDQQELSSQADIPGLTAFLQLVIRGLTRQSACYEHTQIPDSVITLVMAALHHSGDGSNV